MDEFWAQIRLIPPVTRSLMGGMIAVTTPVAMKLVSPYLIVFLWKNITRKWEIWRLFTPFLFVGTQGLQVIFDMFIIYRNSIELETNLFSSDTAEYVWSLFLIMSGIIAANVPLNSMIFFQPLQMALLYLWSKSSPNSSLTFYGIINIPSRLTPFAMLGMEFIRSGFPATLQAATGLATAYFWWVIKKEGGFNGVLDGVVRTPDLVRRWVEQLGGPRGNTSGGTSFGSGAGQRLGGGGGWQPGRNAPRPNPQTTSSTSTNMFGGRNWGSGNRLGG